MTSGLVFWTWRCHVCQKAAWARTQHPCRWGRKGLACPLVTGDNVTVASMGLHNRSIGRLIMIITTTVTTKVTIVTIIRLINNYSRIIIIRIIILNSLSTS